jgi:hypothetical protein
MSALDTFFLFVVFLSLVEATSGHNLKASQDRAMSQAARKFFGACCSLLVTESSAAKRTGNGPNNNPQKAQGHAPVPQRKTKTSSFSTSREPKFLHTANVSSKPQAHSQNHAPTLVQSELVLAGSCHDRSCLNIQRNWLFFSVSNSPTTDELGKK